jgi:hypothetical protein
VERPALLGQVGLWPASIGLFAVAWFELISDSAGSPITLGLAALGYTLLLLGIVASAGLETTMVGFDVFTAINRLFSAISPFGRGGNGKVVWRGWLRALPVIPPWRGLWVFVVTLIGTVTFDGASGSEWFANLTGGLAGSQWRRIIALVGVIGLIALAYFGASTIAARLSERPTTAASVAQRFAHTLIPIALAYAFAHYFTLVVFEGQQLLRAISDPLGLGWDLFGTADFRTVFPITTTAPIWYVQVASIVLGHVLGVVLAHDRALADFGSGAIRSQYAMLALMIGLTSLGLLVLAG